MKTRRLKGFLLFSVILLMTLLVTTTISCTQQTETAKKLGVVVTILPQAEFVKTIGGDKVEVTLMVQPGASPHTYEPTPSHMTALAKADMYAKVGSGVEFELVWMDKLLATNPDMLVVDCSRGIELHEMDEVDEHEEEEGHHEDEHEHNEEEELHEDEHEHNEEQEHHHEGIDPHIWMSPANAAIMVRNITDGLITTDPDNESFYRQNRDAYLQQLEEIDREIRDGLAGVENRQLMVYHPAFGYLAREYGFTMISIEKEGKEPTTAELTDLIEQVKAHDIRVIFAEPQFNPKSAEVIAKAIGGKVVLIDALAEDYIGNLRFIMNAILLALE